MPIQPSSSKVVLNSMRLITSSSVELFHKIKFSDLKLEESSLNLEVKPRRFLIVVSLDTVDGNQFPTIKGYCNTGGNDIIVSTTGKSYYLMASYAKDVKGIFGIELIDINERIWFAPLGILYMYTCRFGFSVNPNYVTLNGITF